MNAVGVGTYTVNMRYYRMYCGKSLHIGEIFRYYMQWFTHFEFQPHRIRPDLLR